MVENKQRVACRAVVDIHLESKVYHIKRPNYLI